MIRMNNIVIMISTLLALLFSNSAVAAKCLMPQDTAMKHEVEISPSSNNIWIDTNTTISKNTKNLHIEIEGSMIYYPLDKKVIKTLPDKSNRTWGEAFYQGASYATNFVSYMVSSVVSSTTQLLKSSETSITNITKWFSDTDHLYKDKNKKALEQERALDIILKNEKDENIKANQSTYKECNLNYCFSDKDPSACIARKNIISEQQEEPCFLRNGKGILIKAVPNRSQYVQEDVKTFFLKLDQKQKYISLKDIEITPNDSTEMKLFISFLGDNDSFQGSYQVHIRQDMTQSSRLLSSVFKTVNEVFSQSSKKISQMLMEYSEMQRIFLALVTIYISISGFLFSSGILTHKATDMLKHYMKICIICMLADVNAATFFIDLGRSLCVDGSQEIANMIMNLSIKIVNDSNNVQHVTTSMLDVYDGMIDSYLSLDLHVRIWSLLFSKYLVFIPIAYVTICTFILGCVRSAVLYVISIMGFSLLFAIAPIMMCLAFSRFSKDLFSAWTRSIINCALVNIFLSVILAMFAVFLFNHSTTPFNYIICGKDLIESSYISTIIGNISLWEPIGPIDITVENLLTDLIVVLMFKYVISFIPDFVETIAPSIYNPLSDSKILTEYVTGYSENLLLRPVTSTKQNVDEIVKGGIYAIKTSKEIHEITSQFYRYPVRIYSKLTRKRP